MTSTDPTADADRFASHTVEAGGLIVVPADRARGGPVRLFRSWDDAAASVDPDGPEHLVRLYSPTDTIRLVLLAYRRDTAVGWVENPARPPVVIAPRIPEGTLRSALSRHGWLDPDEGRTDLTDIISVSDSTFDPDDLEGDMAPVAETLLP